MADKPSSESRSGAFKARGDNEPDEKYIARLEKCLIETQHALIERNHELFLARSETRPTQAAPAREAAKLCDLLDRFGCYAPNEFQDEINGALDTYKRALSTPAQGEYLTRGPELVGGPSVPVTRWVNGKPEVVGSVQEVRAMMAAIQPAAAPLAPDNDFTSELEAANVGLADEAARMRMALSELVDAGSAFDNRDDMSAAEEQAAEKRWLVALKGARPFTEAALLAPSAIRATPPSDAGKWVTVPREPTPDMAAMGGSVEIDGIRLKRPELEKACVGMDNATAIYRAMLAAAPAPAEGER